MEREQTYTPIINALLDFYKDVPEEERLVNNINIYIYIYIYKLKILKIFNKCIKKSKK